MDLTDEAQRILDFEARWWTQRGGKDAAILAEFGHRSTTYYARLNALLDDPDALAYAPALVKRLRRVRDQRAVGRSRTRTASS